MKIPDFFNKTLDLDVGGLAFSPSYMQAAVIVFLVFLLVMTLAKIRRMYVDWSLKGAASMILLGFILAMIVEGFLLLGGRTILTEVLGWKNAPKPIETALDIGREELVKALGVTGEIPSSNAQEKPSLDDVISSFQRLTPDEAEKARSLICAP